MSAKNASNTLTDPAIRNAKPRDATPSNLLTGNACCVLRTCACTDGHLNC